MIFSQHGVSINLIILQCTKNQKLILQNLYYKTLSYLNYKDLKIIRSVSKTHRDSVTGEILQRAIIFDQTFKKLDLVEYQKKEDVSQNYFLLIKSYFNEKGIEINSGNLMYIYTLIYLPFGLYSLTTLSSISIILKFASLTPYIISPKFAYMKPVLETITLNPSILSWITSYFYYKYYKGLPKVASDLFKFTSTPSILTNITNEDLKLKDFVNDEKKIIVERQEFTIKKYDENFLKNGVKENYF